jgi:hypothetical protein
MTIVRVSEGVNPLTVDEIQDYRRVDPSREAKVALRTALIVGVAFAGIALFASGILGGFNVLPLSDAAIQALIAGGFLLEAGLIIALCVDYRNARRSVSSFELMQWNMGNSVGDFNYCRFGYYFGDTSKWTVWNANTSDLTEKQRGNIETAKERYELAKQQNTAAKGAGNDLRLKVLKSNLAEIGNHHFPIITLEETGRNLIDKELQLAQWFAENSYAYALSSSNDALIAWDTNLYEFIGGVSLKDQDTPKEKTIVQDTVAVDLLEKKSGAIIRVISGYMGGHDILNPTDEEKESAALTSRLIIQTSQKEVKSNDGTFITSSPDVCCLGMDGNATREDPVGLIEAIEEGGFVTDPNDHATTCVNPSTQFAQLDWVHVKGNGNVLVDVGPSESHLEEAIPLFDPEKNASDHRPVAKEIHFRKKWSLFRGTF